MYHYSYLHDQWLILSLGGGTVLLLLVCLSYLAMWRPRPPEDEGQLVRASQRARQFIPWVLIVIYVSIFIYYFISPFLWLYWPEQWG